jgi:replication initiation protein RepC
VLSVCGELQIYALDGIRHWHELVQTADRIRPMLEKFDSIRSPGGYLRALTRKAAEDGFSSGPMVMALITDRAA